MAWVKILNCVYEECQSKLWIYERWTTKEWRAYVYRMETESSRPMAITVCAWKRISSAASASNQRRATCNEKQNKWIKNEIAVSLVANSMCVRKIGSFNRTENGEWFRWWAGKILIFHCVLWLSWDVGCWHTKCLELAKMCFSFRRFVL